MRGRRFYDEVIEDFKREVKPYTKDYVGGVFSGPFHCIVVEFLAEPYMEMFRRRYKNRLYYTEITVYRKRLGGRPVQGHLLGVVVGIKDHRLKATGTRRPENINQCIDFRRWLVTHGYGQVL